MSERRGLMMAQGNDIRTFTVTIDSECTNCNQIADKILAVAGTDHSIVAIRDKGTADLEYNTVYAVQYTRYANNAYVSSNAIRWRGSSWQSAVIAPNYDGIAHTGDTYTVYEILIDF